MNNTDNKHKIQIEFNSDAAAQHFISWLCGQGEQDYWMWMEAREQEEDGNITATRFDYSDSEYSNVVKTTCGRLTS